MKLNKELWNDILLGKGKLICLKDEYKNFYDYIMINKKLLKDLDDAHIHTHITNGISDDIYMMYTLKSENRIILYSDLFMKDEQLKEEKEYSALEIIHMIEEGHLNDNDIITNKYNNEILVLNIRINYTLEVTLEYAPYRIKKCEPKYITFDEAVKSGKRFKYKNWTSFNYLNIILSYLGRHDNRTVRKLMSEKVWLVEED